jgi:hypothetical protein
LRSLLVIALLVLSANLAHAAGEPGASRSGSGSPERLLAGTIGREIRSALFAESADSSGTDTTEVFVPGNWDSVLAAYDQSFKLGRQKVVRPKLGVRYSKVEGLHLEGGATIRDDRLRITYLEGRFGYDFGRKRPNGLGVLQVGLYRKDGLLLELSGHGGVRPFGNDDPYGNTLLALIAGYDTRQYLLEREGSVLFVRRFSEERQVALGWVRAQQDPLRPVARFHFFGSDKWMVRNEAAEAIVENGVRLRVRRSPPYLGETVQTGLVVHGEATAYGGRLLHGSREYSRTQGDLWYTRNLRGDDTWEIHASGTLATGRAPQQAWGDLGGAAGLIAFPPRGLHLSDRPEDGPVNDRTAGSLIGTQRLVLRAEYRWNERLLRKTGIPLIRKSKLILVPLAEVGSVWGDPLSEPILRFRDLRAPHPCEVHWDLGIGLRKDIGYSGVLTQAEIDFAWPMGADTGPARITVRLSSNWLD